MKKYKSLVICLTILCLSFVPIYGKDNSDTLDYTSSISTAINVNEDNLMTRDEVEFYLLSKGLTLEEVRGKIGEPDITPKDIYYYVYRIPLNVTDQYRPELEFTLKMDGAHGAYYIQDIMYVDMQRNYNGMSKQFQGSIHYHKESNTRVSYVVNGDFYNNGQTSVSFSAGNEVTTFTISYSSDHYKYFFDRSSFNYGNVY